MTSTIIFDKDSSYVREHYQLNETIVTIISENEKFNEIAKNKIKKIRRELENFIRKDIFFKITFDPYKFQNNVPDQI